MFAIFSRGRKAPLEPQNRREAGSKLHDAKLAAWAIAIGERRPTADPPFRSRRQHRGLLDDLPQPETPELAPLPTIRVLVEVIARLFMLRPFRGTGDGVLAGDPNPPVGETVPVPYIDRSDTGELNASAPAGRDPEKSTNRAA